MMAPKPSVVVPFAPTTEDAQLIAASTAADSAAIETTARALAEGVDDVLVFGMGGSALGAKALLAWAQPTARLARTRIMDDLDPIPADDWRARLNPKRTRALVVSRSGTTRETLANLEWFLDAFGGKQVSVLSLPGSPLSQRARAQGWDVLTHPPLGGRFAGLSPVGMVPARVGGAPIAAIRQGAQEAAEAARDAARGAAWCAEAMAAGAKVEVMVVYDARWWSFALWRRQLVGESLGKAGQGWWPLIGRGPQDHHSLAQMWLDGPDTAAFTLIAPAEARSPERARALWAAFVGAREALLAQGKRVRVLAPDTSVDASVDTSVCAGKALGGLMMGAMLEILALARRLGVDPYGQPAVEAIKRASRLSG